MQVFQAELFYPLYEGLAHWHMNMHDMTCTQNVQCCLKKHTGKEEAPTKKKKTVYKQHLVLLKPWGSANMSIVLFPYLFIPPPGDESWKACLFSWRSHSVTREKLKRGRSFIFRADQSTSLGERLWSYAEWKYTVIMVIWVIYISVLFILAHI